MKNNIFLAIISGVIFISSCTNENKQATAEQNDVPLENVDSNEGGIGRMEFTESAYDFGQISEGEIVNHTFTFKNTGDHPVILAQVSASCGCTTPTYTSTPILPGKTGQIEVEFNSDGQVGQQQKIITIASNAESNIMTVQLKGEVLAKK